MAELYCIKYQAILKGLHEVLDSVRLPVKPLGRILERDYPGLMIEALDKRYKIVILRIYNPCLMDPQWLSNKISDIASSIDHVREAPIYMPVEIGILETEVRGVELEALWAVFPPFYTTLREHLGDYMGKPRKTLSLLKRLVEVVIYIHNYVHVSPVNIDPRRFVCSSPEFSLEKIVYFDPIYESLLVGRVKYLPTPYLAPEVYLEEYARKIGEHYRPSGKSDVYALGRLMLHALTGSPYTGGYIHGRILDLLVDKMLKEDPWDRVSLYELKEHVDHLLRENNI